MAIPNWLVLGLGNPLAGADGFGPAVVACLRAAGNLPAEVELIDVHTDLLGNLDRLAGRDHVVLVDAVLASDDDGVRVFSEEAFSTWEDRSTGAHGFSALVAVRLFRQLRGAGAPTFTNPRITLVAHFVSEADFSCPPRPDAIQAGAEAVRAALALG